MKKLLTILASCVAGCSFSVLDAELPKYRGQPIEALVARLGYPDAEQTLMGRKVYVWTTSSEWISTVPTTTTGYVGAQPVLMTGFTTTSDTLSCRLRVFVDGAGRITGSDYDGNNGACYRFSGRLAR